MAAEIERANALHRAGSLAAAENIYEAVLQKDPRQVDALHFLGMLRQRQNRGGEARALIEHALALNPGYIDARNNLGNVHKLAGRLDEAQICYMQVLEAVPDHPGALSNLAVVLEARGEAAKARVVHLRLIERYPQVREFRMRCGEFLRSHCETMADVNLALDCFRAVLASEPRNAAARKRLGLMLNLLERRDEAAAVYREWLVLEPDNAIARHMLAAASGCEAPARAGDAYVRNTFDAFAASFDDQLLGHLDYVAPQRLHAALAARLGEPAGTLDVLDAGCGTGLCGPLLRSYARQLVGVDLSPGMLELARPRGYDRLEVGEITALLRAQPGAWDLVLSADTLVYFGDLGEVLAAAAQALRPGGLLGFTLEALADETDRAVLAATGRYQHSRTHVERRIAAAGCELLSLAGDSLRKEAGNPVPGWVVVARKPRA